MFDDSGWQNVYGWATNISAGPPEESGQAVWFDVSNDNNALFAYQPCVYYDGLLYYEPLSGASCTATVTVVLRDSGGTANGGVDASPPQAVRTNIRPNIKGKNIFFINILLWWNF